MEAHGVVLFNSDFSEWPYIARGMDGSHTFSVDAGSYVAVVVALDADGTLLTDANGDYLFGPANVGHHRPIGLGMIEGPVGVDPGRGPQS